MSASPPTSDVSLQGNEPTLRANRVTSIWESGQLLLETEPTGDNFERFTRHVQVIYRGLLILIARHSAGDDFYRRPNSQCARRNPLASAEETAKIEASYCRDMLELSPRPKRYPCRHKELCHDPPRGLSPPLDPNQDQCPTAHKCLSPGLPKLAGESAWAIWLSVL